MDGLWTRCDHHIMNTFSLYLELLFFLLIQKTVFLIQYLELLCFPKSRTAALGARIDIVDFLWARHARHTADQIPGALLIVDASAVVHRTSAHATLATVHHIAVGHDGVHTARYTV